ncbi:MAG: glycogen/starch synthase [Gammaproteobacteria bacterium]|nr:glycogen/starch synthase [Gammaproteobacteria bacterium]
MTNDQCFFSRAVLEMLRHPEFVSASWQPEVIHGHDWIAGLLPLWLRHAYQEQAGIASAAFVYTLHNAGIAGQFGYQAIKTAGLEELGIYKSIGESSDKINFMARGILAADAVNTISPRYAAELMQEKPADTLFGLWTN